MSQGYSCKDWGHKRAGHWVLLDRQCNHSAFSGGRRTFSEYSCVKCMECGALWRTKAAFTHGLRDATDLERRQHTRHDADR